MRVELTHIWTQTLEVLEQRLPKPSFETWLKHTKPLAIYDDTIVVGVQSELAKDRLESRYASLIRQTLREMTSRSINLHFVIPRETQDDAALDSMWSPNSAPATPATTPPSVPESSFKPLNSKYTFDTFVVGNSNRFAHAASLAVAEAPARAYNPLFVYGGVGLGKTHLMHAIGHFVSLHSPNTRVAYISSETFTNEFINSIRDDKAVEFQTRYRNVDVLLIDDIQFLAGKERTQEEFYHTFNAIHEANKQLVISSDRPPKEIPTLEERLRSRFEWGLICDIQPPDLETRIAILRKKAQAETLAVPDDVLQYIASHIETNIRELEGALTRVVAYCGMLRSPVSQELALYALRDILPPSKPKKVTIPSIMTIVSSYFGLTIEDLKVRKRTRNVAFPRQIAMFLARNLTDNSLPKIGEEFGGRDHTTVLHAVEKVTQDLAYDPSLSATIEQLTAQIRAD